MAGHPHTGGRHEHLCKKGRADNRRGTLRYGTKRLFKVPSYNTTVGEMLLRLSRRAHVQVLVELWCCRACRSAIPQRCNLPVTDKAEYALFLNQPSVWVARALRIASGSCCPWGSSLCLEEPFKSRDRPRHNLAAAQPAASKPHAASPVIFHQLEPDRSSHFC